MTDYYFTDRQFKLLGIASDTGEGVFAITDDTETSSIAASSLQLEMTLSYAPADEPLGKQMAAGGNFVLYTDDDGTAIFMEIMHSEHSAKSCTDELQLQDVGLDLLGETVGTFKAGQPYTIAQYLNIFTKDSGWEQGINEITNLTRTLEWDSADETALSRILSVAAQFDNAELSFSFDFDDVNRKIHKYINVYKQRGHETKTELVRDVNVDDITTTTDLLDLCTAIKPTGGTPEGKDVPITLAGYKWTDPDGRYELTADGTLRDTVANQKWSRIASGIGSTTDNGGYITRSKSYEGTTQASLLQSALTALKQSAEPAVNYDVSISDFPADVGIGDTLQVVDDDEQVFLSARVLELKRHRSLGTAEATLGDFLIEYSQVNASLEDLAAQLKLLKATTFYPWVRYAKDDQGTDMSALPAGMSYWAVVYGDGVVPSDEPAVYAGKWALFKGADGGQGTPGEPGKDGRTPYLHTAWADSVDGATNFSTSEAGNRLYIGTMTDFTEADPTDPSIYTWQYVKGEVGETGPQGPAGKDITSFAKGTVLPSTVGPANSQFWLTNSSGQATAVYVSNGSSWVATPMTASMIVAATFKGMNFEGVTFTGSSFSTSNSYTATADESIGFTNGTTVSNTQTLDSHGYRSVTKGSIMGSTVFGSYTGTTTIDAGRLVARSDFASGNWSELSVDPVSSSFTARNSAGQIGTLGAWDLLRFNNTGKVIWSGALYPNASTVITPSTAIYDCLNGWVLVWSGFTDGAAQDYNFNFTFIPKAYVNAFSGKGVSAVLTNQTALIASKYVYVTSTTIMGNDNNRNAYVLRQVLTW